jgi:type II secretory pathway pseudopilin PulG
VEGLGRGADDVKIKVETLWKIFFRTLVVIAVIAIAAALILPQFASTGKLYGNQRALVWFRLQMRDLRNANTNNLAFDFYKLSTEQQKRIVRIGLSFDSWMKTNFDWASGSNRTIVIVSGKQYDNAPQPSIWNFYHKNPAHVVGYSDGTTGLISPQQFTNLNLNGFVSAASLATNSELNIFKN